ncbi:MAG: DUF4296 domain-containing protein [Aurantibacter sp.]
MKRLLLFSIAVLVISCAEKLIQEPDNLIPAEKMVAILNDLAILNTARTTSMGKLEDNGVESMKFIFKKYGIDSAQFVRSDRYYASRPIEYESIYSKVEAMLEAENKRLKEIKQLTDSLKQLEKDSINAKKYGPPDIKNRSKNDQR